MGTSTVFVVLWNKTNEYLALIFFKEDLLLTYISLNQPSIKPFLFFGGYTILVIICELVNAIDKQEIKLRGTCMFVPGCSVKMWLE